MGKIASEQKAPANVVSFFRPLERVAFEAPILTAYEHPHPAKRRLDTLLPFRPQGEQSCVTFSEEARHPAQSLDLFARRAASFSQELPGLSEARVVDGISSDDIPPAAYKFRLYSGKMLEIFGENLYRLDGQLCKGAYTGDDFCNVSRFRIP